ncbi:MAG: hypothetical protein JWP74_3633 [Marmoricola sp.]|nr:hypothetical protein [Marmoricola sp.]
MLVAPRALPDLELALMALDMRAWPVRTAPICEDGPRQEFQIRRRLVESHHGDWDVAADWTPVWIGFGPTWITGEEPLPWAAHEALWRLLASYGEHVRFQKRLSGISPMPLPRDVTTQA